MNIVTGYRGTPHITSNEMQALNQGIFGRENYVLNVGQQFAATLVNATTVSIADGEGVIQGVQFRIPPGETENVTITSGTEGYKRIDYICARYEKSTITGIESVNLVVVQGVPDASSPSAPTINTGDVLLGASPVDFPLYEVDIDGLTPTLKLLNVGTNLADVYFMHAELAEPSQYLNNESTTVDINIIPSIKLAVLDIWVNVRSLPNINTPVQIAQHLPTLGLYLTRDSGPISPSSVVGSEGITVTLGPATNLSPSMNYTGWGVFTYSYFYKGFDSKYPLSAFTKKY